MKENIIYKEITVEQLDEYGKIPFFYKTNKKYKLKKINNGLGGIVFDLIDVVEYYKDFGSEVTSLKEMFDLSNWKFFVAYNEVGKMIAGCIVATKTNNCNMLEKRDDLALLWDIRVKDEYKYKGIGQKLFELAKKYAQENGFKKLKVECQNTNSAAVNFYYK